MKPDWKDAPEWANYVAMDSDYEWFWFEKLPQQAKYGWVAVPNSKKEEVLPPWPCTLEKRP